jgi:hypothetical protein
MDEVQRPDSSAPEEIPLGQRFFDSHFLLLALGLLIMVVFFTGWGLIEIMTLPQAPLP